MVKVYITICQKINNNPLSHSDLQALSNAIDNPVNNAKEAEKMLSNLSDDVIAENLIKHLA
jgi:hypothetical protein